MKKKPPARHSKQTQTYPLRALPDSRKKEIETVYLPGNSLQAPQISGVKSAQTVAETTSTHAVRKVVPLFSDPGLSEPLESRSPETSSPLSNILPSKNQIGANIAGPIIAKSSNENILEASNSFDLGASSTASISISVSSPIVHQATPHTNISVPTTPKPSNSAVFKSLTLSAFKSAERDVSPKSPSKTHSISIPTISQSPDKEMLGLSYSFLVGASTMPDVSLKTAMARQEASLMDIPRVRKLAHEILSGSSGPYPGKSTPGEFPTTSSTTYQTFSETDVSKSTVLKPLNNNEAALTSKGVSPKASSESTHTFIGTMLPDSFFETASPLIALKHNSLESTDTVPSKLSSKRSFSDETLLYSSTKDVSSDSFQTADQVSTASSKSVELFETPSKKISSLWIPKISSDQQSIFKQPMPKHGSPPSVHPSASMTATQSYLESQKFFGSLASSSTTPSTESTPFVRRNTVSEPLTRKERLHSILKNRTELHRDLLPEKTGSSLPETFPAFNQLRRPTTTSGVTIASGYSSVSSAKRLSNPFSTTYNISKSEKPLTKSVSEAGTYYSNRGSRGTTLKARFADFGPGVSEDGKVEEIFPWCTKCRCIWKYCQNFSLYDPVCNISWCFPNIQIFWVITLILGFLTMWISLAAIWGDAAWPEGVIFQFYTLAVGAYTAGWIFACLNLPPSIGMFAAGILFRNLGWYYSGSDISTRTRSIVVAFILLRSGLNTEAGIFKTRGGLVSRMAFIPGISEMLVASLCAVLLLNFTWDWGFLYGCSVAPLSPLAIIYPLVRLREEGYGEDKGVTSVLLMMYALDNITLVTLFGMFFTITFDVRFGDKTAIYLLVLQSFGSIFGGIGVGLLLGTLITFFPHRYDPYCGVWRTILLSCSGLGTVLFSHTLNCDGAGYLCTIVMAFTASVGWKALGTPSYCNPVNIVYGMVWHVLQPIALGLIGGEVSLQTMDIHNITASLMVVPFCMTTRFIMAFLMSCRAGFNRKERLFMALLSLTKGTPQAALAPMTMELANQPYQKHFARHLIISCILEILFTLPVAPLVASFTGPRLLKKYVITDDASTSTTFALSEDEVSISRRQRYRSIVSRIHTDNEFMLYSGTGESLMNTGMYKE